MNDAELEALFRSRLHDRADDVDVPPGLVDRARDAARPRHRRFAVTAAVGAAAAVLVVAFAIDAAPRHDPRHAPRGPGVSDSPSAAPTPTTPAAPATGWRTEAWHGVQVRVPASWGWGAAPPACAVGSVLGADGTRSEGDPKGPYVGRPIYNSDLCSTQHGPPSAPYVWLGSDVEPGSVDLGGGWTQQTIDSHGVRVTVATQDAALREQILASATTADCPASVVGYLPQAMSLPPVGLGEVKRAQVCVYQRDKELELVYATKIDAGPAQAFLEAAQADVDAHHAPGSVTSCPTDELVVVRLAEAGKDGEPEGVQQTVVNLTCSWVTIARNQYATLDQPTTLTLTQIGGLPVILRSMIGGLG